VTAAELPDVTGADADVKACCVSIYSTDWARFLLGDSFHPGGLQLTSRLAGQLGIDPSSRLLDIASGGGASAIHLAQTRGCAVVGVDLSAANVAAAERLAAAAGLTDRVTFVQGDSEQLPFPDSSVDAVLCECALCTFPDKPQACREMARVLKPGGRVGISDVTRSGSLPAELDGLLATVACIADACSYNDYRSLIADAGLTVEGSERYDHALHELIGQIRLRLIGAKVLATTTDDALPPLDTDAARTMLRCATDAVRRGQLGYATFMAVKSRSAEQTAATPDGGVISSGTVTPQGRSTGIS